MSLKETYGNMVGYNEGDNRYDHVGRPKGMVSRAIDDCNGAPNTVAYLDKVIRSIDKEKGMEIGD